MNDTTKKALYDICVNHKDVLVVDVMNYLHRYMWVYRDLSVTLGDETICTGHIYGFTNLMVYLKEKFPNCAIILALDGIDKERRATNSEYKAQREHSYDVAGGIDEIVKMCSLVEGVYTCYDRDYEADDVIGVVSKTVSKMCIKNGIEKKVYILSNDKDMYQLVTDGTICDINIIKKFGSEDRWYDDAEIVSVREVMERFNGVKPEDLVKFRAITGDPSDNLKGYYRFRKANAAIIAENFDYDVENKKLVMKDGVKPCQSWRKFLPAVLEDMKTFQDNYAIMKLKDFDFEIIPVNTPEFIAPIDEILGLIKKYCLNKYKMKVVKYSQYRDKIIYGE